MNLLSHEARKWQSWDSNPEGLPLVLPKHLPIHTLTPGSRHIHGPRQNPISTRAVVDDLSFSCFPTPNPSPLHCSLHSPPFSLLL